MEDLEGVRDSHLPDHISNLVHDGAVQGNGNLGIRGGEEEHIWEGNSKFCLSCHVSIQMNT